MCFLYVISFLNAPFVLFVQAKFDFDNSLRSLECDNIKVHMTAAYSFVFLSSIDDFTSHPSQSLVYFLFHTLSLQLVKSPTGLGHLPFSAVWCLLLPGEPQTKDRANTSTFSSPYFSFFYLAPPVYPVSGALLTTTYTTLQVV